VVIAGQGPSPALLNFFFDIGVAFCTINNGYVTALHYGVCLVSIATGAFIVLFTRFVSVSGVTDVRCASDRCFIVE
jgi:hypothetical protein